MPMIAKKKGWCVQWLNMAMTTAVYTIFIILTNGGGEGVLVPILSWKEGHIIRGRAEGVYLRYWYMYVMLHCTWTIHWYWKVWGTGTYCSASETDGDIQYIVGLMPYSNTVSEILDNVFFHGNIFSLQWYSFTTLIVIQFLITNLRILKHYQSLTLQHLGSPIQPCFIHPQQTFHTFHCNTLARD